MPIPSQQGSPPPVEGSENLSFQRLDTAVGRLRWARPVRLVMSRRPQKFRLAELTNILKAMVRAGIPVDRVERDDHSGALKVFSRREEETSQSENEWDSVK